MRERNSTPGAFGKNGNGGHNGQRKDWFPFSVTGTINTIIPELEGTEGVSVSGKRMRVYTEIKRVHQTLLRVTVKNSDVAMVNSFGAFAKEYANSDNHMARVICAPSGGLLPLDKLVKTNGTDEPRLDDYGQIQWANLYRMAAVMVNVKESKAEVKIYSMQRETQQGTSIDISEETMCLRLPGQLTRALYTHSGQLEGIPDQDSCEKALRQALDQTQFPAEEKEDLFGLIPAMAVAYRKAMGEMVSILEFQKQEKQKAVPAPDWVPQLVPEMEDDQKPANPTTASVPDEQKSEDSVSDQDKQAIAEQQAQALRPNRKAQKPKPAKTGTNGK